MAKKKASFSIVSILSLLSALLLQNFFISNTSKISTIQNFCSKAMLKKSALKIYCGVRVSCHTCSSIRVQGQA